MVRGLGYIRSVADIEHIALGVDDKGTPIRVKDIATVQVGPELRRGLAEWNGEGEVVGGIVVMRYGENALKVIERVKQKSRDAQTRPAQRRGYHPQLRPLRADLARS